MKGRWITADKSIETPMFVKRFQVKSAKKVTLSISGLGYFFFTLNGKRVSEDLFTPAPTDYMPRETARFSYPIHDTLTHKVFYLTYDITEAVTSGENTLSVVVGNGWFRQKERIAEGITDYCDRLCTVFELTVEEEDGSISSISSDGSEECYVYPILKSNLFLGDTVDTRMLLSPLPRGKTELFDAPLGKLSRQTCPADRVIRRLTPIALGEGCYDVGENISGRVKLRIKGASGETVTVLHAEEMRDGEPDHASAGGDYTCGSGEKQLQRDVYILNGEEVTVYPEFAWHGFRYFKVTGNCEILSVIVEVIHTDLPVTASFRSDNGILNWLYDAFLRSLLSNFHGSFPSDCPHRERLGYTGDGQVTSLAGMLTLDSRVAYRKWIDDIFECQCRESGHVQHTAPFGGGGGGPGGWGSAIVFVPYQYHKVYGDRELLALALPKMKKWIGYLESRCEDGLVCEEEKDGWCLGDWCAIPETRLPAEFVNTCCLVRALAIMEELAEELCLPYDDLTEQKNAHKEALYKNYYQNGSYLAGEQGADAYALWAALPGEGLAQALICRYEARDTFDTGFIATEILCDRLFDLGRGDIAIKLMASDSTACGFNFMRQRGATTLYECMHTDGCSHNHHMFGGCVHTLFTGLFGIKLKGGRASLSPCLTSGLGFAEGSLTLPQGRLSVKLEKDTLTLETEFPIEVTLKGKTALTPVGKTVFLLAKSDLIPKEPVTVTVDRPMGSYHPTHKNLYYPVNYGYIKGIVAPDGEEQDAYLLGLDRPVERFTGRVIAVIRRLDDCEDKWVVAPEGTTFSAEEILKAVSFQERFFKTEIIINT